MKIELVRDHFTEKSTTGRLYVDDVFQCYTLEDIARPEGVKVKGQTAIPFGEYEIIIDMSRKYQRYMPLLLNVPMFEGIRIHSGNMAEDSEGCILVGRIRKQNWIGESKLAYADLFQKLKTAYTAGEKITIEITREEI